MGLLPQDEPTQARYAAFCLILLILFMRPDCDVVEAILGLLGGVVLPTGHLLEVAGLR